MRGRKSRFATAMAILRCGGRRPLRQEQYRQLTDQCCAQHRQLFRCAILCRPTCGCLTADRMRRLLLYLVVGKVFRLVEFRPELYAAPENRAYRVESME